MLWRPRVTEAGRSRAGGFTMPHRGLPLVDSGVDAVTVQAWIGHAWIATTNLYLRYLSTSATGPVWPF
jgi:hypothetical protein